MEKIDAIILAGGRGTRLRGIVDDVPKPLAIINGKPFLDILLGQLDSFLCIERVVLAVGYKHDMIVKRYGGNSRYNFEILFSVEEDLVGTGGAIRKAMPLTKGEEILVLNGDSYVEIDFGKLLASHQRSKAVVTVVLNRQEDVSRYGHVEIDKQGRIVSFEEKVGNEKPSLVNAGMYLIRRECFNGVEEGVVLSFEREILTKIVASGVYGFIADGKFIDIGLPETYQMAGTYLKGVNR